MYGEAWVRISAQVCHMTQPVVSFVVADYTSTLNN